METNDTYRFGDLLRGFRNRAGLSQGELAKELGVTRGAVYQWEKGILPRLERMAEISRVLNLSADESNRLVSALLDNAPVPASIAPVVQKPEPETVEQVQIQQVQIQEERSEPGQRAARPRKGWRAGVGRIWRASLQAPFETVINAEQRKQNRKRMLITVHTVWIKGVLEKSLYSTAPITLELLELPGVLNDPWQQEHREVDEFFEPARLSSDDIGRIYDDAGGALLLLGEPGSGKTTLLLKLTALLLERARQDERHPIPVFFNLSSWSAQELPLNEWLVKELQARYQVPDEIGNYWVQTDQILPLLDGLDEVAPARLKACIDAINVYRNRHGLMPMVVCARSTNYMQQSGRITLQSAIAIQPLTSEQIANYLATAGRQMELAQTALQENQGLWELITTPLMLGILRQADAGTLLRNLQGQGSPEMQLQQILDMYVQRMFLRRRTAYTSDESMSWLTWLAGRLKAANQSEFYLEDMQISWLSPDPRYRIYPSILIGLVYGLFLAIAKGVNYAVLQGADQHGRPFGLMRGVFDGLMIGIGNALFCILLNGVILGWLANRAKQRGRMDWRYYLISFFGTRLGYGLLNGVLNGLLITVLVDAPAGIYNGLFIGVIYAGLGRIPAEIKPSKVFTHWSWARVRQGTIKYAGGGLLVGLLYGIFTAGYWQFKALPHPLSPDQFFPCLLFGLCMGLIIGLFIALMGGLSHDELDDRDTLRPNQGMWNSFWNSTISGIAVWVFFGLFFGVAYGVILRSTFQLFAVGYAEYGQFFPRDSGLMIGLTYGMALAAFVWLSSGATACMQHLLLRFLLWRKQYAPWKYARFLDAASEQLLLRKVGGGYAFIHQTLQEHFATRDTLPPMLQAERRPEVLKTP